MRRRIECKLFSPSFAVLGEVGAKFGVMLVVDPEQSDEQEAPLTVEVATFRSDVGYSDGRHPDNVVFSKTAQEDVKRRDFTINALLMDPETDSVGLCRRARRSESRNHSETVGIRKSDFREDKLHLVRAVRFAA